MPKTPFTTPVLRFVQGSLDEAQTKDANGNLRVVKTGPNAGQPSPQWFVAGAIAKTDPAWPAFWALLVNQAVADFPALFPQGAAPVIALGGPKMNGPGLSALVQQGLIAHPQFSFKVIDGDGWDDKGKPHGNKEGFARSWVVRFGSGYPPRCFHAGHYAAHEQIQEKNAIKRGFYIRVSGTTEGNGEASKPALYLNLSMVELSYVGTEIVSGPNAEDAFAGGPGAMPAGATAIGGTPTPPPPTAAAPPPPTAAAPPPPPLTSAPVEPYTGFMNPPPAAPAAVPPPPPPAPPPPVSTASPGRTMLPAANGQTYEAMISVGWTDDTLRAHGMMA